jgi:hypothetical protein
MVRFVSLGEHMHHPALSEESWLRRVSGEATFRGLGLLCRCAMMRELSRNGSLICNDSRKVGLRDLHAVCMSVYSLLTPEPFCIKLGVYITTLSPPQRRTSYIPPVISLCVYMCILSLLGNGSVKTLPRQGINTKEYKNCWRRRFLCGTCRIKGSKLFCICLCSYFLFYFIFAFSATRNVI